MGVRTPPHLFGNFYQNDNKMTVGRVSRMLSHPQNPLHLPLAISDFINELQSLQTQIDKQLNQFSTICQRGKETCPPISYLENASVASTTQWALVSTTWLSTNWRLGVDQLVCRPIWPYINTKYNQCEYVSTSDQLIIQYQQKGIVSASNTPFIAHSEST